MKNSLPMTRDLKRNMIFFISIEIIISILIDLFSFTIQGSKMAIEANKIVLSFLLLGLHFFESPFRDLTNAYSSNKEADFSGMLMKDALIFVTDIMNLARNKVYYIDKNDGITKKMSDGTMLRYLKEYYLMSVRLKMTFINNVFSIIMAVVMAIASIKVAILEIEHSAIVGILLFCITLVYTAFAIKQVKREVKLFDSRKEFREKMDNQQNDIVNVEPLSKKHMNFMLNRFVSYSNESIAINRNNQFKRNIEDMIVNLIVSSTIIAIVVVKIMANGIDNFNSTVIVDVLAFATLYSGTISKIDRTVRCIQRYVEEFKSLDTYKKEYELINAVYLLEKEKKVVTRNVKTMTINPFEFSYVKENSEVFSLKLKEEISFTRGDVVLLNGRTGSGKSTLLSLISKELTNPKCSVLYDGINVTIPFSKHSTSSKLGTNDVFSELTFDSKEIDIKKLEFIMRGLTIYEDLSSKFDTRDINVIIDKLKESYINEFSEGQQQRLILTRFLYNLEDDVSMVLLDEPTIKLDEKTTKRVISFMINYISRDRFVIISSHNVAETKEFADYEILFNKNDESSYEITCSKA